MMYDEGLKQYVTQVNKFPKLSAERETELARRWRDSRDTSAAQQLVCGQLGYVIAIATKYRRYHVPLAELISEGNMGLVKALEKFDPEREIRFVTYAAFWVRSQIVSCILKNWSIANTGVGALKSKTFFKLRRESARARNLFGSGPEFEAEVAARTGLAPERVRQMLEYLEARDVSLDEPLSAAQSGTARVDSVQDGGQACDQIIMQRQSQERSRELVGSALKALDRRERFVITHRFLVCEDDALSLAEIGRRLGVSRERTRQLEVRAREKLKRHLDRALRGAGLTPEEVVFAA